MSLIIRQLEGAADWHTGGNCYGVRGRSRCFARPCKFAQLWCKLDCCYPERQDDVRCKCDPADEP
jgi:hypothetical protein